jgi:hypothetical protein
MAKVIPVGQPVNDAERSAIAYLRDRLPDSFVLLHNFEIERQGERFEIDIALLTPHALYLIDVKGTRGTIDVYGNKWYPEGARVSVAAGQAARPCAHGEGLGDSGQSRSE